MIIAIEEEWYVQKGTRVLGPFAPEEIARFLLLGRVRNTDRVSRDGELWEPLTQVPELIPEEMLDLVIPPSRTPASPPVDPPPLTARDWWLHGAISVLLAGWALVGWLAWSAL